MELVSTSNQLVELKEPTKSYQDLLETQRDLLLNQVENLQRIVASQCELTGVNPLSQEMAAGALSIKIGKKPRDLLNSKAVKHLQNVFSIKDAVNKKEAREITDQFGITATQVKDFFTLHKSRVRKSLRLAAEKADKSTADDAIPYGMASTSDCSMPAEPVPLDTITPVKVEEGPSCSTQHEILPGTEEPERNFVENIFKLMRKEESFSGQLKLLEWILRMGNPLVLKWFLDEGGLLILVTWLSEAATEEQTSFIGVILKVLFHLPLRKARKGHLPALLHSVNALRFYHNPGISSRSENHLGMWIIMCRKMLPESNLTEEEMLLKQSIEEIAGDESWNLKEEDSERPLRLLGSNPGFDMKVPSVKLLTSSADDSRNKRGALSYHTRERRKVQMVEQPGQRSVTRNSQVAKSTSSTQSRPLSADDIQKAKMRAHFMQNKHGKTIKGSNELAKIESQNKINPMLARASTSGSNSYVRPELIERKNIDKLEERKNVDKLEERKNVVKLEERKNVDELEDRKDVGKLEDRKDVGKLESSPGKAPNLQVPVAVDVVEPPRKRYKRTQIPWRTPPAIRLDESWAVGMGANSKEVEVQNNRIKRERETIYRYIHEIPPNPREPWDREMDYDDTLTPVIPIETLPDPELLETPTPVDVHSNGNVNATTSSTHASASSSSTPEPDLELLAELLKNPDLVFALTSGQSGDLSSTDTLKLLDLIKANGASVLVNLAGGLNGKAESKVEVSLPSPTPSTDPVPNGVKPDFSRNPFTKQHAAVNGNAFHQALPASTLVQPQIPVPQPSVPHVGFVPVPPPVASLQTANQLSDQQWHSTPAPVVVHHSLNTYTPETMMNVNNLTNFNRASPSNIDSVAAASYSLRAEHLGSVRARTQVQQEVHYPYYEEPKLKRARQDYDYDYEPYQHQNGRNMNNYNGYVGGPVQVDTWDGRNRIPDRPGPGYESWSPEDSPSRGYGYNMPGRNYQDRGVDGYMPDRPVRQNPPGPPSYGYRDNGVGNTGDRRWQGYRR